MTPQTLKQSHLQEQISPLFFKQPPKLISISLARSPNEVQEKTDEQRLNKKHVALIASR